MNASAKDLRLRTKQILASVARGEEVIITHRGVPKAVMRRIGDATPIEIVPEDEIFGMWAKNPRTRDVAAFVRELRKPRTIAVEAQIAAHAKARRKK